MKTFDFEQTEDYEVEKSWLLEVAEDDYEGRQDPVWLAFHDNPHTPVMLHYRGDTMTIYAYESFGRFAGSIYDFELSEFSHQKIERLQAEYERWIEKKHEEDSEE